MRITELSAVSPTEDLTADLAIVGGGPASFAIVRELRNTGLRILVLESGLLSHSADHEALNTVESIGDPGDAGQAKRGAFHGSNLALWSNVHQGYGVRCRGLGGSGEVWAGKSAAFDAIDYQAREWVGFSGWPLDVHAMAPFVNRAADLLNLGPNCYDEGLWSLLDAAPPEPRLDPALLRSVFWQFARSRTEKLHYVRFGREYAALNAPNVRVLLDATVTSLQVDPNTSVVSGIEVSTIAGETRRIRIHAAVLAAGAIENARLLLLSSRANQRPIGDEHGLVGRFLMDHPSATLARFRPEDCPEISERFGFFGLKRDGQTHTYLHGLALSPQVQEREGLLNCAAYMMGVRAPDDPWAALRRLLTRQSTAKGSDLAYTLAGSGLLAKGLAGRWLLRDNSPKRGQAERGLPHKLLGVEVHGLTEQIPNPESRVSLSDKTDRLGQPLAKVDWRIDDVARRSLVRIGKLISTEFERVGLPAPVLEPWVAEDRLEAGPLIDMAHSAGTTRMAERAEQGVVDVNCEVFGTPRLFVAGASVFPTSGHVNLTLMIVAMAIRLADHLRSTLRP